MKAKDKLQMPSLRSDVEAEEFIENADLTQYDLSQFQPMRFELAPKSAVMNVRLPGALLQALKEKADAKGIPYTRYVRMLVEADLAS